NVLRKPFKRSARQSHRWATTSLPASKLDTSAPIIRIRITQFLGSSTWNFSSLLRFASRLYRNARCDPKVTVCDLEVTPLAKGRVSPIFLMGDQTQPPKTQQKIIRRNQ